MPILVMMPDNGAETDEGAAGCASGSQEWSGTRPALTAKPARQHSRPAWMAASDMPRICMTMASKAVFPSPSSAMPGMSSNAPPAHMR